MNFIDPRPESMILGKRGRRSSMRRTASMTGIIDPESPPPAVSLEPQNPDITEVVVDSGLMNGYEYDQRLTAMALSPRYDRRDRSRRFGGGDHQIETAQFLRTCGLCNRRLSSRRDIYIYRGETAFCSIECREEKIKQEERKEKPLPYHPNSYSPSPVAANMSEASCSSNTETIAAA